MFIIVKLFKLAPQIPQLKYYVLILSTFMVILTMSLTAPQYLTSSTFCTGLNGLILSLFPSTKLFSFDFVLCISYVNSFSSIIICYLVFSMFYLLNSFTTTRLFICKIYIIILSIICFIISCFYSHSCFFFSKPSTL